MSDQFDANAVEYDAMEVSAEEVARVKARKAEKAAWLAKAEGEPVPEQPPINDPPA